MDFRKVLPSFHPPSGPPASPPERRNAQHGRRARSGTASSSAPSTPGSMVSETDWSFIRSDPSSASSRATTSDGSLRRASSPSLRDAFQKVVAKTAHGLQKVADYSTHADVFGASAAPRQAYPDLRHVIERYKVNRHIDGATVAGIAKRIVAEDPRLRGNPAFAPLDAARDVSNKEYKAFKRSKKLRDDLVGLKQRGVSTLESPFGEGPTLTQRFGHMREGRNGAFSLQANTTLSSEAIKDDMKSHNALMRQYNANLGSIKDGDKVVFVRSARTDSAKKLEELLLFGAAEQKPGTGPYRAAIISAMDLSAAKDIATRFHGENEVDPLGAQRRAVDELFPFPEEMITRTLADGREVVLQRPVLLNTVLSGQAKHTNNIEQSRRYNAPGLVTLGRELAATWKKSPSPMARNLADSLAAASNPAQMTAVLNNSVAHAAAQSLAAYSPKDALALIALRVGFTGRDFAGRTYNGPTDPGKELTLLKQLLDVTGRTPHVQCKSGQDRTLTLACMFVTAYQYEAIRGVPYNPKRVDADPAAKDFACDLFTQAADTFGEDPIKDVRGAHGAAKWATHPVPGEMYKRGPSSKIGLYG